VDIFGAIKRGLTVSEWNVGVADVTLEELTGSRDGDHHRGADRGPAPAPAPAPEVVRPHVRWLNKPWFIRYQADPCLLEEDGQLYLYYEDVLFGSMKGRLRAGRFDPVNPKPRLGSPMMNLNHHAAYPYVFKHDGVFYCVPETGEKGFVALYRADRPLGPWSRHSVLFDRLPARDTSIVFFGDRWWLFCNVCNDRGESDNADLQVWHAPEPWGPWTAHALQPVKRDVSSARPAGRPFVIDGVLYRPAQDCGPHYGARIAINRVLTLTPMEFAEEVCSYVEPVPDGLYSAGLHTLAYAGGLVVVDGQFEGMTPNLYKTAATAWGKAVCYLRPPSRRRKSRADV
jgi:hypothetical protein